MIRNITAFSKEKNALIAYENVTNKINEEGTPVLIIFCSPEPDFEFYTEEFHREYPHTTVIGVTSDFSYSDKGFGQESLLVQAVFDGMEVSAGTIFEITHYPARYSASISHAVSMLSDTDNTVCLAFSTTADNCEELVQDTFRHVLKKKKIPVVGASAGGGRSIRSNTVSLDGRVFSEATVFVLMRSLTGKVFVYKENVFKPTKNIVRTTDVDCEARTVYEYDGNPAADTLKMLLGVAEEELEEALQDHPMGRIVGDDIYITSSGPINKDRSIPYYARIYNQTRLAILEPDDLDRVWSETAKVIKSHIPNPSMTFTVNCVNRWRYFNKKGKNEEFANRLTGEYKTHMGIIGYGEQFNYEHFNQTMVMIVFE